MMVDGVKIDNVIFTDESTFQVENHARSAYRRIGEPRILHQNTHVGWDFQKRCLFKTNLTATDISTS